MDCRRRWPPVSVYMIILIDAKRRCHGCACGSDNDTDPCTLQFCFRDLGFYSLRNACNYENNASQTISALTIYREQLQQFTNSSILGFLPKQKKQPPTSWQNYLAIL